MECSFGKPAEKFFNLSHNFILKIRKKENIFFQKRFFLKMFLWPHRKQFLQPSRIFLLTIRMSYAQSPKKIGRKLLKENVFFPLDTQNAVLTTLPKKDCRKSENFLFKVQKKLTIWKSFQNKKFSSKCSSRQVEHRFDNTTKNILEMSLIFWPKSENNWKKIKTFRKVLLKKIFRTRRMQFWEHNRIFFVEKLRTKWIETCLQKENLFSQSASLNT